MDKLNQYNWPGNVRELENILERAMILVQDTEIKPDQIILDRNYAGEIEDGFPSHFPENDENSGTLHTAVDVFEKQFIEHALLQYGSIRHTAKALGVSHTTIMNKIKKYGLKSNPI